MKYILPFGFLWVSLFQYTSDLSIMSENGYICCFTPLFRMELPLPLAPVYFRWKVSFESGNAKSNGNWFPIGIITVLIVLVFRLLLADLERGWLICVRNKYP